LSSKKSFLQSLRIIKESNIYTNNNPLKNKHYFPDEDEQPVALMQQVLKTVPV
jgi:hypothetical protein